MPMKLNHKSDPVPQQIYEIKIKGQLDPGWTDWFDGMVVTQADENFTVLTGPVLDQSALHGLLKKVRDMNLSLVSVCEVEPGSLRVFKKRQINEVKFKLKNKKSTGKGGRQIIE